MSTPNPLPLALAAAKARHMDNPAIAAIVENLERTQKLAKLKASSGHSSLEGYQRGAAGQDGYGLMHAIDASIFTVQMREISDLHAVAILTEVLVTALNAMGEDIEL